MASERLNKAMSTYDSGCNCAQSVVSAFAEEMGISQDTFLRLSSCFGGGMRIGATCGALSGALMILGLAKGFSKFSAEAKSDIETQTLDFINLWISRFEKTDCREILGLDVTDPLQRERGKQEGIFKLHCPHCISGAVELLESILYQ